MVLDPLEDAEEADDQVEAVHDEPHPDEADERELFVAKHAADAGGTIQVQQYVLLILGDVAVPSCGGG